jgi:hypothetical protein
MVFLLKPGVGLLFFSQELRSNPGAHLGRDLEILPPMTLFVIDVEEMAYLANGVLMRFI